MFKKLFLLALCACLSVSPAFATDLLTLIPSDVNTVVNVNLQKLYSIPEIKVSLEAHIKEKGADYLKGVEAAGFDPTKDVSSVIIAIAMDKTEGPTTPDKVNAFALLEGRFDKAKALEALKNEEKIKSTLNITEEGGITTATFEAEKGKPAKMAIIDSNLFVFGTQKGVDSVLATKAGKDAGIKANKILADSVAKLNKNATVSAAVVLPEQAKSYFAKNEQAKALAAMEVIRLALDMNNDLNIAVTADFANNADIKAATTLLEQLGTMLQQVQAPYGALVDLAKNFKVTSDATSATITSLITKASIIKLIENKGAPEAPATPATPAAK